MEKEEEATYTNEDYYRGKPDGTVRNKGQWTASEKELFYQRLSGKNSSIYYGVPNGKDKKWGFFSMAIPKRNGIQCAEFYRYEVLGVAKKS